MLSVVIEAFKKLCSLICTPFANYVFGILWLAFEVTLHSSSARLDRIYPVQIHLIGIRNSPDHYSVHNKEVKFSIWIYYLAKI